jgi:hypothetical protein
MMAMPADEVECHPTSASGSSVMSTGFLKNRIGSLRMPGLQFYIAGGADADRPVLIK